MISDKIKKYFDLTVDIVFGIILLFLILSIFIGAAQLFSTVWKLLAFEGVTGKYINIITDVLTLYVLIELSRSLVEYFNSHKIRLTFIVDAAIVFIIREMLIALFHHKVEPTMIYAFAAIIFVLGALRVSSILIYQREKLNSLGD